MDPHGKLPLKGSRLVRVYKDAKRPILGGSGRLDRGQVCSRHKGDHPKPTTAAATGDHLEESFLWRGRSVHIEICDGTHTMPGELSTSMWVILDNSTFPKHYSHFWWRIGVSRKLSLGNYCTVGKISGEFTKALKMTFLGLKTIYIFIIHTKE